MMNIKTLSRTKNGRLRKAVWGTENWPREVRKKEKRRKKIKEEKVT